MADGVISVDGTGRAFAAGEADEIPCPHCGQPNPKQAATGAILDCRHCDRSFTQPRSASFARG
ncbi:MAG: hypothetical protein VCC67_08275, partial [Myxococcota bacterium]